MEPIFLGRQVIGVGILVLWVSLLVSPSGSSLVEPAQNLELEDEEEAFSYEDGEVGKDSESGSDEQLSSEDLTEIVTKLEREAEVEEQRGLVPQIFSFLKGALTPGSKTKYSSEAKPAKTNKVKDTWKQDPGQADLPEDLTDKYFQDDDIVEDITAGIEESLSLAEFEDDNEQSYDRPTNNTAETRQLAVYMFQGQYLSEPRLNVFIDGAVRNLAGEMKSAVMEPIYFRVLPKGRVVGRAKPIKRFPGKNRRRRKKPVVRPGQPGRLRQRRPFRGREQRTFKRRRRLNRRRRRPAAVRNRMRRNQKQAPGVGGGRVSGLSKIVRDGDAEMQMFGNYTLIRSHMNMGPIELVMQFRTKRGLRRTSATLPRVKIHTVTRVSTDGSEMMDFLLDRPHPETIQVRGRLFPMAQRLAQNIFSRLFMPDSFLVARIREKSGLALMARPGVPNPRVW